jgi:hypothetical protein
MKKDFYLNKDMFSLLQNFLVVLFTVHKMSWLLKVNCGMFCVKIYDNRIGIRKTIVDPKSESTYKFFRSATLILNQKYCKWEREDSVNVTFLDRG